jgi:hypothetical protein
MKRLTVILSEVDMATLDAYAEREKRPKAEVVREAVANYFRDHPWPLPRSIGIIGDSEVTSTNYREWLRENWHPE